MKKVIKPLHKIEVMKGQREEFNCNKWLRSIIAQEVDQLQTKQCQCLSDAYYLYFKRGAIKISKERIEGYTLASAVRISTAWSREQIEQWCHDLLRCCPCLPELEEIMV